MAKLMLTPILTANILDQMLVAADSATGHDTYESTSNCFVMLKNSSGAANTATVTVTPIRPAIIENGNLLSVTPIVYTVAAGETQFFSVPNAYQNTRGTVRLDYENAEDLQVGVGFAY